ncbi:MAG: hypothetical protein JSS07_11725 [Proteobacteria bacterium]|nr:hypothetical protein [Pseudomonadota bacterium]
MKSFFKLSNPTEEAQKAAHDFEKKYSEESQKHYRALYELAEENNILEEVLKMIPNLKQWVYDVNYVEKKFHRAFINSSPEKLEHVTGINKKRKSEPKREIKSDSESKSDKESMSDGESTNEEIVKYGHDLPKVIYRNRRR